MPWLQRNPFSAASRAGLLARMDHDGCRTFSDKVRWVEEHMPNVDDPAAFVGALVRGEQVQNPVRVKGGAESWRYAKAVADAYAAAPMFEKAALPSYRALADSIERIYKQIASKVRVQFVAGQPYTDDKDLSEKVKATGILYISTDFNTHPFFNPEQNLKFRAVHDWFSHISTGAEFSQRGELKAYNAQAKLTPKAALPALFTEVVGQACYATTYGDFPPQKVAILRGFDYENVGLGDAAPPLSRKNPPDAGYDNLLGEGAFSKAYAKPDQRRGFYEFDADAGTVQVDRGPRAIETITSKQVDAGYEGWGDPEGVDASKIVILLARDRLKSDKKALAYLPDLHFVRVDTRGAVPELVFVMPAYKVLDDLPREAVPRLTRDLGRCVDVWQTGQGTLEAAAQKFLDCVRRKGDPDLSREAPHVAKSLRALHEVATSLPLSKYRADMHGDNVAVDAQGHLILLDPMVAEMNFEEAAKLLTSRAKKNPAQPELFRDSNKVTVTKGIFATHPEYADEAISLIGTAYAPIGGHANMRTRADLMADDADVYRFEDIDADLEPDVLQVSKTTPYGLKTVAMGHDGTKEAKRKAVEDKVDDFRTFGNFGEVSGALAKRVLTAGVPVVGDQRLVEKILNKKVNWVGLDPDFPGIYGWYERMLGGHMHRKILVGLPDLNKNPSLASELSPNQQSKYLGNLKGAAREARAAEILYRREHRSDAPFATDAGQQTKHSSHAAKFAKTYGRAPSDTADAAKLSGVSKKILDQVYARGMAAWQTGHRPGASQHAWAMARVESFLTGGPTMRGPDADLARKAGL